MNWKTIRLELGRTPGHPSGSPGRAYLIRLPLDETGRVDEAELSSRPRQATVRRFWPSEPDLSGLVERRDSGWAFRWNGCADEEKVSMLYLRPLQLGSEIIVTEPDGRRLPFRVACMRQLA
jgi:hypothetical protein